MKKLEGQGFASSKGFLGSTLPLNPKTCLAHVHWVVIAGQTLGRAPVPVSTRASSPSFQAGPVPFPNN